MDEPQPHGFTLVGHSPGSYRQAIVRSPYVYIAAGWEGLKVLTISDPSQPRLIGELACDNYIWGLTIHNELLYLAEHPAETFENTEDEQLNLPSPAGIWIVDICDPSKPRACGRQVLTGFVDDVLVVDHYLFALGNIKPEPFRGTIHLFDVSDPVQPNLLSTCPIRERAQKITLLNTTAYIAASDGIHMIDVTDATNPVETYHIGNRLSLSASDVVVDRDHLYATAGLHGLRVFELHPTEAPHHRGRTVLWGGFATSIAVYENTAYITDGWYGLWRLDITQRAAPIETGFFPIPNGGSHSITYINGHIVVAAEQGGLYILRDSAGQRRLNQDRSTAFIPEYWGGLSDEDQARIEELMTSMGHTYRHLDPASTQTEADNLEDHLPF